MSPAKCVWMLFTVKFCSTASGDESFIGDIVDVGSTCQTFTHRCKAFNLRTDARRVPRFDLCQAAPLSRRLTCFIIKHNRRHSYSFPTFAITRLQNEIEPTSEIENVDWYFDLHHKVVVLVTSSLGLSSPIQVERETRCWRQSAVRHLPQIHWSSARDEMALLLSLNNRTFLLKAGLVSKLRTIQCAFKQQSSFYWQKS